MQISHAASDCLAAVFELTRSDTSVGTSAVARRLGISAPAVAAMLKRLSDGDLVERAPGGRTRLTGRGERDASHVLRRRRVLEWFLAKGLGYPPERVTEQAERLEHGASDAFIHAILRVWGEPEGRAVFMRPIRTPGERADHQRDATRRRSPSTDEWDREALTRGV